MEPKEVQAVRESLVAYGAPLAAWDGHAHFPLEEALARGLVLAREDATVLRVLPLVLARNYPKLDWDKLVENCRRSNQISALGFVAEIASELGKLPDLAARATALWQAPTKQEYFFPLPNSYARRLADARSPAPARRWGFVLNVEHDSFRQIFEKHFG
ncbi:MAG TPA: hypothetical protein VGK67_37320 [Myxococcales bacterium]|jgi:hypothetical protein